MRRIFSGTPVNLPLLLLFAVVVMLPIFIGCGGGGGGGGSGLSTAPTLSNIIVGEIDVAALNPISANSATSPIEGIQPRISGAWNFSQAIVFLEEAPQYSAQVSPQGKFVIEQVPPGSYHLIVRLSSVLTPSYKLRLANPVQVVSGSTPPTTRVVVTEEDKADSYVRILVINQFGLPVPGTKVSLWGELFTYEGDGFYISPAMPAKTTGKITLDPPFDSQLQKQDIPITAGTFVKNESPTLGSTLTPTGSFNRPPTVIITPEKTTVRGEEEIKIKAVAQDPDGDLLIASWTASVGTFSEAGLEQAIWRAPNFVGSISIVFAVTEKTTKSPVYTAKTKIFITIATSTPPPPPPILPLVVDIQGTATIQIPGSTVARYNAIASGGIPANYAFSWVVTGGTILSGEIASSIMWQSPVISEAQSSAITMTVVVTDGNLSASKTIPIAIVAAPNVEIASPADSLFPTGNLEFVGQATDFDGTALNQANFKWYLATGPAILRLQAQGKDRFTYRFKEFNTYNIAFTATNLRGFTATTTRQITIENTAPTCTILQPPVNSAFEIGQNIAFLATATDFDEGPILDNTRLEWSSSINGTFARGLSTTKSNLASGQHRITFLARDRNGKTAIATISVIITNLPLMDFTPASGATFFGDTPIAFSGGGTDSRNIAITTDQLKWYVNGSLWKTAVASFAIIPGELPPGMHSIRLEGADTLNKTGVKVHLIRCGIASPTMSQPASGTVYSPGFLVNCVATPTNIASISFSWFANRGTPSALRFGTGPTARISTLSRGLHLITYVGSDSQNVENATSVMILVNSPPTIAATPSNNSVFFGGRNVAFLGSGLEADGTTPLQAATMRWYLDSNPALWKIGASFSATPAEVNTGSHLITFAAADQYQTSATISRTIVTGYNHPTISSPSAWGSYTVKLPLNFQGTPDSQSPLNLVWYASLTTPLQFGTGASATYKFPAPGTWTISYLGTDSQGFLASFSREIFLVSYEPIMAFNPPDGGILYGGRPIQFTGNGTETDNITSIPAVKMKWYRNGALWNSAISSFSASIAELPTGTHEINLEGVDSRGIVGNATNTIFTGFSLPAITAPADNTLAAPGATVNFTATPNSSGPITMTWFAGGLGPVGTTNSLSRTFNRGKYTIAYVGTDSAGFAPVATMTLIVNSPPTMVSTPSTGDVFFAGRSVAFTGSGVDASGTAIPAASMAWALDSTLIHVGTAAFTLTSGSFPGAGTYQSDFTGTDNLGFVGTSTRTFFHGWPLANITSPASGTRFNIGSNVSFTGSPNSNGPIVMTWYRSDSGVSFGTSGAPPAQNFATRGMYSLTYIGTDSQNFASSHTIQILVNDPPVMTFTPGAGAIFFTGSNISFSGSGLDAGGAGIAAADMNWYKDGVLWKPTTDSFTAVAGELPVGNSLIRLNGSDVYGTVGSLAQRMYYGYPSAAITSPTSGARFNVGDTVNFTGTPNSSGTLAMEWFYSNGGPFTSFGTGSSRSQAFGTRGSHTIVYIGTDSMGINSSAMITIVVNDDPVMDFTPASSSIFFTGTTINFTGVGTDAAGLGIAGTSMKWYLNGALWKTATDFFTAPPGDLSVGNSVVRIEGTDSLGNIGSTAHRMYYGYPQAAISAPASGALFPIGANVSFTGTPNSSGSLVMEWFHTTGGPWTSFGTGSTRSNIFGTRGAYTVTYIGTDSEGLISSKTISIVVDNDPIMSFTPTTGALFFSGSSITFTGNGTDSGGTAIGAGSMEWLKDGSAWQAGVNTFVAAPGDLAIGNRFITLRGTDNLGVASTTINRLYYGYPLPAISSPIDGSSHIIGANITFAGTPTSSGPITMEWFRTNGVATVSMGTSPTFSTTLIPAGAHAITYIGTDSAGVAASKVHTIYVSNAPAMAFTPINTSLFFLGNAITFTGIGTDSANAAILAANMKWYLNGALWKTGIDSFVAAPGDLNVGNNVIRLEGTDIYSFVGSISQNIYYGYTNTSILSPASGTRHDTGTVITFTATPSTIANVSTFTWLVDNIPQATNTLPFDTGTIASGWHRITYKGTDSGGNVDVASIGVWVNKLPTFTPILVNDPPQYATGPGGIPIYIKMGGAGLVFNATATDLEAGGELPGQALAWFFAADPASKAYGATFPWIVETPQVLTISCTATDSWGYAVSTSTTVWVWEHESYTIFNQGPGGSLKGPNSLSGPTFATAVGNDALVVGDIGNQRLIKINRDTGAGLTTRGDLPNTASDTYLSDLSGSLVDVFYNGTNLMTLENAVPLVGPTRIQQFNTGLMTTTTVLQNLAYTPTGISGIPGAYFLARQAAGSIVKIDSGTGGEFSNTNLIAAPYRNRMDPGNSFLYITDPTNNKLAKFDTFLNPTGGWQVTATNPRDLVLAPTYLLVSDAVNNRITAHLLTTGAPYFHIESRPGYTLTNPSGLALIDNDLYIVETGNNRITRIRAHAW